jgi:hypothetical protein
MGNILSDRLWVTLFFKILLSSQGLAMGQFLRICVFSLLVMEIWKHLWWDVQVEFCWTCLYGDGGIVNIGLIGKYVRDRLCGARIRLWGF